MNATLEYCAPTFNPPPLDPYEPFGGVGALRRFTESEFHKLTESGFIAEGDGYELFNGYIVHKWQGDVSKPYRGMAAQRRFTVDEYHELIECGVLTEGERVELLDGYMVLKMSHTPAHDFSCDFLEDLIRNMLPPDLCMRAQKSITLKKSEPEPDIAVVRGPRTRYRKAHPIPADIKLLIEVAYSSLLTDRREKAMLYAEAGIVQYWVVNVEDRQIEVFTDPVGQTYSAKAIYPVGGSLPLVLDGQSCGEIAVGDLF